MSQSSLNSVPGHVTDVRVRYADTDRAGVVYHANYLLFIEDGRTDMMRAMGCPYAELEAQGFVMPVTETALRFRAPARYDDLLRVESRLTELERVRLRIDSRILHGETGKLLCEGHVRLACVNGSGRPTPIPAEARELMSKHVFCKPSAH